MYQSSDFQLNTGLNIGKNGNVLLSKIVLDHKEELIRIRRQIHANPELSFKEYKTTQYIIDYLSSLSPKLSIQTNNRKTGVIALLKGSNPGKCIALRADIDALPIQEENDFSYKSKNINISHACGHDAHTAILLVTAKILCSMQNNICGSIKFIFQPAEEGYGGAKWMVDAVKCLQSPHVHQIYGLHVSSTRKLGTVGVNQSPKPLMSGACMFKIFVNGIGGHGAYPHLTTDVMVACGSMITQIHTIVSRNVDPRRMGIISIGKLITGYKANIIADRAELDGTIRWYEPKMGNIMKKRLKQICEGIGKSFNVKCKLEIDQPEYPAVFNSKIGYEYVSKAAKKIVHNGAFLDCDPSSASEDFSEYLLKRPGAYFFVGAQLENGRKDGMGASHHTSTFKIDERCMIIGCQMFIQIITDILGKNETALNSKL
eukprot:140756_1